MSRVLTGLHYVAAAVAYALMLIMVVYCAGAVLGVFVVGFRNVAG